MAIITKAIKLETTKQNLVQAVIAKQSDCNSRFLKVTFLDEGATIPLETSSQVTINAEREDGESKSFFGEVNGDDTATVPLHSWILELEGIVNCDVSIIGTNGSRLTTTSFIVKVEKAACSNEDISSDPQYDVLANLIEEVSESNKNIHKAANALEGTASGSIVTITDISPLEHEIKVKLSLGGSSVDDITAVTLTRYGENTSDNPQNYTPNEDGTVEVTSLYPTTTLVTDADGVTITAEYNKDANKVISETRNVADDAKTLATTASGAAGEAKDAAEEAKAAAGNALGWANLTANALKGNASGSAVIITDGSPLEHEIKVGLISKPTFVETVTELNGVSYDFAEVEERDYIVSYVDYDGAQDCEVAWIEDSDIIFWGDGINTDTVSSGDIIRVEITHIEADEENGIEEEWINEYYLVKQEATYDPNFDFSSVTLTKYGKNLFDDNVEQREAPYYIEGETKVFSGTLKRSNKEYLGFDITSIWDIATKLNAKVTISFDIKSSVAANMQTYTLGNKRFALVDTSKRYFDCLEDWQRYCWVGSPMFNNGADGDVCNLSFYGTYGTGVIPFVKNIQIEIGTEETTYAKFQMQGYTPNADGTVDNVTSLYPTTTLVTDTEGVIISAEYNKDLNKVVNDIYQKLSALGVAVLNN